MTNNFFLNKKVSKNTEFHAHFKSVENVFKKCTIMTNMTKSEKAHISVMFMQRTFFW